MENYAYIGLRVGFLIFLGIAAWQDARKGRIKMWVFTGAGVYGLCLNLLIAAASYRNIEEMIQTGLDLAGAAGVGIGLLILSSLTEEAIGRGDGWFFMISGIYLGFWNNVCFLFFSLMACFPVCIFLIFRGILKGKPVRTMGLPFLPFTIPAGIGVLML